MVIKKIIPTEHQEQCAVIKYCDWHHIPIFAIPNGSSKSIVAAKRFKAEGLRSGVPDLFVPVPTCFNNGLFIEMKRRAGGVLSPEQQQWIDRLSRQGYSCVVCKGSDEAIEAIEKQLKELHYGKKEA